MNQNKSFEAHESHIKELSVELQQKSEKFVHIKKTESAAYAVCTASLESFAPLFVAPHTWLTIGDNDGFEANFLAKKNQTAHASDISDTILCESEKEGLISIYSQQNVEQIQFVDSSFDYVLCKETVHHFPRPALGLYEMLRVCKKGVVLVSEPVDILSKMPTVLFLKNVLDMIHPSLIGKVWKNRFSFEPVGNYVYKLSEREIEKLSMGIGLPCLAFRGQHLALDIWNIKGILDEPINKKAYKKATRKKRVLNFFSKLGLIPYTSLSCILFKEPPEKQLVAALKGAKFKVEGLPRNPYLS
jgi:2-polyprenyl-3-methyl-5-hydroxy-6-metoxy-1,4-benzoquinol methylase